MTFDEWHYRIKIAFQGLVKAIGTNEAAGAICGVSDTTIHRYGDISPGNDHLPPLRIVLMLEAACGQPIVTTVMAERSGCRVVSGAQAEISDCMMEAHGRILKVLGEATAEVGEAAKDGHFSPNEIKRIFARYADAIVEINAAQGTGSRLRAAVELRSVS